MALIRELSIETSLGAGVLVVEHIAFHETLSEPFSLEIDLLSSQPDLDISSLVGDTVNVAIDIEDGSVRYLNGYVTHMTSVDGFDQLARYHVTVRPWLSMLSSRKNSRIFQNQSVPDIVKGLFREHGFADFDDSLSTDYSQLEFVVQYQESDLAFVSRLLARAGIYYYFKHEKGRHVLVLADSLSAHHAVPGYEKVPFHPRGSPTPSSDECINSLQIVHQWQSGAYAGADYDFERPRANLLVRQQASARHKLGDGEVFEYPTGHLVASDGQAYVRARLEAIQSGVEVIHGSGNVRGLGAGNLFLLTDHPIEAQNIQYLITSAALDATNNPHETGGSTQENECHFSFSGIDSSVPFKPALATPAPRVQGPQTALVVGQSGAEIWTDKYARVKVQFHWDREGANNENSSCWVRVAQLWAGSGWGGIHIPRIGQEVIVDFLEGDPDRPIVTGRVYNADNMPPYDLPANQTQSGIKSRSSAGGSPSNFNEIRFEDKKGSEELFVQAEKDHNTTVKNNQSLTVAANRTKSIGGDETVSVSGNRTETVGKDETITIAGNRTESVGKNESITIGQNQTLSVGASRSVSVAASESISIGAAQSETVAVSKTVSVGAAYSLDVGAASSEAVGGNKSVTAGGNLSESAGGGVSIDAGKDVAISAGKNFTLQAAENYAATAGKKASFDAADQLTLSCGDATIVLKKNGDITINGKKIQVTASGDLVLKGSKIAEN